MSSGNNDECNLDDIVLHMKVNSSVETSTARQAKEKEADGLYDQQLEKQVQALKEKMDQQGKLLAGEQVCTHIRLQCLFSSQGR